MIASEPCGFCSRWPNDGGSNPPKAVRGYTSQTEGVLNRLADHKPETLAGMHGSSCIGKSDMLLTQLAVAIKESFHNGK